MKIKPNGMLTLDAAKFCFFLVSVLWAYIAVCQFCSFVNRSSDPRSITVCLLGTALQMVDLNFGRPVLELILPGLA